MFNPSYLIKSRHGIFYFRYPLPIKLLQSNHSPRVSVSLKTRCPREALKLAKDLEYHGNNLIKKLDWGIMDHAEIMTIFKNYYAEVLERAKARIDMNGPLPKENVHNLQESLKEWSEIIGADVDDLPELLGTTYEDPEDDPLKKDLQKIMDQNGVAFKPDSREYGMMKAAYKHVKRNYIKDLLAYNNGVTDFSLLESASNGNAAIKAVKPGHKLSAVIGAYLDENKTRLSARSHNEMRDCLNYLTDWLGQDFSISKIDDAKAREAKEFLIKTPKHRRKHTLLKGKPLSKQISLAKEHGLETLGSVSVNKYLAYFAGLFSWAKDNRYIKENNFSGIGVKAEKKKNRRRSNFTKEEVRQIIDGLGGREPNDLTKSKTNYWGALIAVYTGARRNEVAALLPEDVKKDPASGIWYFDITDEAEGKTLKTEAARRIVPVHSSLLDLGFLEFVEESRKMKGKIKNEKGLVPRLLYDLTYTENEGWGRNLGRWLNERYLVALGLKTDKKTMHSLRHSFITYLSAAGVDGATIKSLVGHEADTVTTQVYTHYGVDHLPVFKEAIERLPY